MADWFLVLTAVIVSLICVAVNVYILVYFQHPEDKNTAYFPKFVVVLGLTLAEGAILLLPLDVANAGGTVGCEEGWNDECGGLSMTDAWYFIYCSIAFVLTVFIPFSVFYYEADDGEGNRNQSRGAEATRYTFMTALVFAGLSVILWATSNVTSIPIQQFETDTLYTRTNPVEPENQFLWDLQVNERDASGLLRPTEQEVDMPVNYPVYLMALMGFMGYWFFCVFAAIGLVALPLDLIREFVYRPRFMPADIYAEQRLEVQRRTAELIEVGELLQEQRGKAAPVTTGLLRRIRGGVDDAVATNKFKQMVYLLEQDHEDLKECHNNFAQHNPLVPVLKLFAGCLCSIASLLWFIHICLYMLVDSPPTQFLNEYFLWFDSWFPLFGTISVGVFALYLLAAAVKGCFKFGMRFFLISLHPMALGGTYMNAFLFNLALVLLFSAPAVQFCTQAFRAYARVTDIDVIFESSIRYLHFYTMFYEANVFAYILVALTGISLIYLLARPGDKAASSAKLKLILQESGGGR